MEDQPESRNEPKGIGSDDQNRDQAALAHSTERSGPELSTSLPQFETVTGTTLFTIKGYSAAKGFEHGKYVTSGTFTVGGHAWAVYFYPTGKNENDEEYISLFIALVSHSSDVDALFEVILVDMSGKEKHKIHSHFTRTLQTPYRLKSQGSMWGYRKFFRKVVFEKSDFLKDDTLEFRIRVGVLVSSVKPTKLVTTPTSPLSPQDGNSQHGSSGKDHSSSQGLNADGTQAIDSQSTATTIVDDLKGLRIEDGLARYYHKPHRHKATDTVMEHSEPEQAPVDGISKSIYMDSTVS